MHPQYPSVISVVWRLSIAANISSIERMMEDYRSPQGVPISWAQVVLTTASCMPPATLTRQRTTFAIPLQPQVHLKPARRIYIQPRPSFAFHRAAVLLP